METVEALGPKWAAGAALRLNKLANLPLPTKAELAAEAKEFERARQRAERKGDRALELLASAECRASRATILAMADDYRVGGTDEKRIAL